MSEPWMKILYEKLGKDKYSEALQYCREEYDRLLKEKKFAEIYDLLLRGCYGFFSGCQQNLAADLCNLLADTLRQVDSPTVFKRSAEEITRDMELLFLKMTSNNSIGRLYFISKTLKVPYLPSPKLRECYAQIFREEKNYLESFSHYLFSSDSGEACASMLVEYQTEEKGIDVDMMIADFVLQALAVSNKQLAIKVFHLYTLNHPKIQRTEPPFETSLLNFISFLVTAIENQRGDIHVFDALCDLYEDSVNRDPCFEDYLRRVRALYFTNTNNSAIVSDLPESFVDMSINDRQSDNN